jgi:arginyl-tRNA synthetase
VTASLATAAGALVPDFYPEHFLPWPESPAPPGPVAEAVAFAGPDAIRYTLARIPAGHLLPPGYPDPEAAARHVEANPAYAVRYAYSCAASTLRWAAGLGLTRGTAAGFRPGSLAHPRERALLDALAWLPEQVARAARRGRPHEFTAFLEELAETYQVCRVACPAWPEREQVVRARLWLTGAAAAGLAAGLELLGVSAPGRL